jgi:sarcosine oxidase gamma subunit
VRGTPTDADLERYIDTIAKVRAAIFGFTQDKDAVTRFADAVQAMISRERQAGPISLMAGMQDAKALADTLLARIWPEEMAKPTSGRFRRGSNASAEALVIGGNRALRALQFDRDDLAKWAKDIGEGWPAKREAWQVQGYRVLAPGEYTVGDEQRVSARRRGKPTSESPRKGCAEPG